MTVKTVETREFDCDRCAAADVFRDDAAAAMRGWTILSVNGREFVLCPIDRERLDRFLMGQKTPAGMRFNRDEGNRMLDYASPAVVGR